MCAHTTSRTVLAGDASTFTCGPSNRVMREIVLVCCMRFLLVVRLDLAHQLMRLMNSQPIQPFDFCESATDKWWVRVTNSRCVYANNALVFSLSDNGRQQPTYIIDPWWYCSAKVYCPPRRACRRTLVASRDIFSNDRHVSTSRRARSALASWVETYAAGTHVPSAPRS